ncbi:hypothetical protein [Halobacteriovorax marinus]|uniref:hypothetical protein n=1 Tax=Halobacteriovorax marinus TaxID=97084 RepID=UPI003A8DA7B6
MRTLLALFLTLSLFSASGQENFGIKGKVDRLVSRKITEIYSKEVIKRVESYNKLRHTPAKYFEQIGMGPAAVESFLKAFPESKSRSLPELIIRESGILILRDRGNVVKFSFKSLSKREVYINGVKVNTPKMVNSDLDQFFKEFNQNMFDAFHKKVSFIDVLSNIFIQSVYAQESDYLQLPDGKEVPHYRRKGYDKTKKPLLSLYKNDNLDYNVNQTNQVLLASIMAISADLELNDMANYRNKKVNLPANLKKLYKKIEDLANTCHSESVSTKGKFVEGSEATKMLTALDRVNERINRLENMSTLWWQELDELVWNRTSFHFDPDSKSYEICKVERIKEIYYDRNLCENMDKITDCLVAFRSSGRVNEKTLTDDQMDLLLENPAGRDYGQDDVLRWIQK